MIKNLQKAIIFILILSVFSAVNIPASSAEAAVKATVSLIPSTKHPAPGDKISVYLNFTSESTTELQGFSLTIKYNDTHLKFDDWEMSGHFTNKTLGENTNERGTIILLYVYADAYTKVSPDPISIAKLNFTVQQTAQQTDTKLYLEDFKFIDKNDKAFKTSSENAVMSISEDNITHPERTSVYTEKETFYDGKVTATSTAVATTSTAQTTEKSVSETKTERSENNLTESTESQKFNEITPADLLFVIIVVVFISAALGVLIIFKKKGENKK